MTRKDFNKQVEKRQRIKSTTLIIGVDVGCYFNFLCCMNKRGEVLGRWKVYNSPGGFEYFSKVVKSMMERGGFNEVLMGMEPTGSYWKKLAFFSIKMGFEVRFIRTTALKHQRELDESSPGKSDIKDAYTLANITREGKYLDSVIDEGLFHDLRKLVRLRGNVVRDSVRVKNRLSDFLDDYFPELLRLYSTITGKGLLAVLEECPFPGNVLEYGEGRLIELITKASRSRKEGERKGHKIFAAAKESIGLKHVTSIARYELELYLKEIKGCMERLNEIEKMMKSLLRKIPCADYILSIPGIGPISTGIFLGELGNPDNFRGPNQIVKYAGYDPVGHDSGKFISKRHISKKGRWRLRKILFFMSLCIVRVNSYFRNYYKNKLEGGNRKLAKKEALCAVIIKLVKVIFALIRDKRFYEERTDTLLLAA
jgi:transposase